MRVSVAVSVRQARLRVFAVGLRAAERGRALGRLRTGATSSVSPMFAIIASCSVVGSNRRMRSSASRRRTSVTSRSRSPGFSKQLGQRRNRLLGFVSNDDVLLAADSPPLVGNEVRKKFAVLFGERMLQRESGQRQRCATQGKQRTDTGQCLGISALRNGGQRLLDERQVARLGRDFRRMLFGCVLVRKVEREHVAVGLEERRLAGRVAGLAVVVKRRADALGHQLLDLDSRIVRASRLALRLDGLRCGPDPGKPGIEVRQGPALEAQRMELPRNLGGDFVAQRLDERLREELVGALVELGNGGHGLERLLVGALQAIQARSDVFEPLLQKIDVVHDLAVPRLWSR